jgi:tagatose 1,6-diphosphate aldolase
MIDMFFKKNPILDDGEIHLKYVSKYKDNDPDGWGLSYVYDVIVNDSNRIVGRCDVRLGQSKTLDLAGHIGYTIYVPYRGHHYAAKACLLMFKQATRLKIKDLIITCNTDNLASYRTCELAGCEFVETKLVPRNHVLYAQGDREKAIFVKHL